MNNNDKKFAVGLVAASLPLMMLAFTAPAANATGVASDVTAIDECQWVMGGVPTSIALVSEEVGGVNVKYVGDALSVSDTVNTIVLGLSGAQDPEGPTSPTPTSVECSFYNDERKGQVEFALATSSEFVASYGAGNTLDADMNFDLAEVGGLSVTANVTDCAAAGFTQTPASFAVVNDAGDIFELDTVTNEYANNAGPRCKPVIEIATTIKASNGAPAGAGQTYSFSGPALTITLRDDEASN